jgi:hypothetical protein
VQDGDDFLDIPADWEGLAGLDEDIERVLPGNRERFEVFEADGINHTSSGLLDMLSDRSLEDTVITPRSASPIVAPIPQVYVDVYATMDDF